MRRGAALPALLALLIAADPLAATPAARQEEPPAAPTAPPTSSPAAEAPAPEGAVPESAAAESAPPAPPPASATSARPPIRVRRTGGLRVETAALILSGQQGGTVPLAAFAVPLPGTAERARVHVLVEIDGSALPPPKEDGAPLRFEVFVYALAGATIQGSLLETVEIDPGRLGAETARTGVRLTGEMALLPGEYTLRVLAGDSASSQLGLRSSPLTVPDFRKAGAVLLPPLFVLPAGSSAWVPARSSRGDGDGALARLAGGSFPAARPILTPGRPAAFRLPAYQLPSEVADLRLEVRKAGGSGGERVADWPARIERREAAGAAGLEMLAVTFTPRDVPQGEYEIVAVAPGTAGADTRSPALLLYLLEDGGGVEVWAEITPGAGAAPAVAETGATAPGRRPARRRRIDERPIKESYRAALGRLAAGEEAAAREAVAKLEISLLTGAEPLARDELAEIQVEVVRELRASSPESLAPLLPLYEELARGYQDRRLVQPAMHAVTMVFSVVELYMEKSTSAESKRISAAFLAGLTPSLLRAGLTGFTERALRLALELDPDQEAAQLCLAVQAERLGRYDEAERLLERVATRYPGNAEARLRWALVDLRQGQVREARARLSELTAPAKPAAQANPRAAAASTESRGESDTAGADDWVLALAFQELVDLEMAAGDLAAAARTAEAGLARLPGDEKLRLQHALLLDLRGRAKEAEQDLATLRPAAELTGATPRHRYGQLPEDLLARTRRELRPDITERLPALAAAVGPARTRGAVR
ncbi:MAG TPA: tetratricopeptide repeat protein [Thermoanaerobaculia bacterium]|nr:tetratricopeptide repeat protein [Thermoanaerobaculia bacterium]